ncbi:methylenetetrahydrofolate reductase (NADPH) [Candidatus Nanopelagicus hibericus]|uniref:Methylenetetrahydrofolate reductase n=1 Tax=Candidatus Nanopelagicus hibericus TaxID=1884915 RepID=A0A249K9M4_9ACTN|nr:methylenetetrahydrofolate reductase [NAD(P)H] [Candidatus Nanopelagicus hibericus]ASY13446.1 methylenetetrahydrofolate reductase (NADPH) [Candidatus Nanopelagicus hibericus]
MSNDQSAPTLSVEFFPPKDISGEERLWQVLAQLAPLKPDFVSVTYGAGGSTRDRTIRVTTEITARTSIPTVAHLTCVGSTKSELSNVLDQYKKAGIESILALRGDPPGGPRSNWQSIPGGFDHADQLVELAIESKDLKVGVAAFPDGHPSSNFDLDKDIEVLLRKEELGASFATTQFFFDVNKWQQLVERLRKRGSKLPIIAGILPITNLKQLNRMVELSGMQIPEQILTRFKDHSEDVNVVREIGIDIATEMGSKLLEMNVPGIHFYTMNSADSTIKIARNLGLVKR